MAVDIGLYSTRLNATMALKMAQISKHAYHSRPNGAPDDFAILAGLKLLDIGFKSVSGTSKNSAQAILVEHEEFLCMAFRGRDEWEDWLDNIDGRQSNSEQAMFGDFHRGFYRSCNDVWDFLDEGYKSLRNRDRENGNHRPLFLTRHSLGGAMATVAAAKLVLEDRAFSSVYTYGQPRVVKRATAQFLSNECGSKYFRFQNNEDVVTRVPARLMGYSHVGSCLYIDVDGAIHTDVGFWYRFLDVVSGAFETCKKLIMEGEGTGLIRDHHIDRYIEKIERWDYMNDWSIAINLLRKRHFRVLVVFTYSVYAHSFGLWIGQSLSHIWRRRLHSVMPTDRITPSPSHPATADTRGQRSCAAAV